MSEFWSPILVMSLLTNVALWLIIYDLLGQKERLQNRVDAMHDWIDEKVRREAEVPVAEESK
jgi:hypothetical protein